MLYVASAAASPMPQHWHAPRDWLPGAICVHKHEGAWNAETGNGYSGGMQFTAYTWASVGGVGRASQASPREQLYRAWLVWRRDGVVNGVRVAPGSWREWGTAGVCGLR